MQLSKEEFVKLIINEQYKRKHAKKKINEADVYLIENSRKIIEYRRKHK